MNPLICCLAALALALAADGPTAPPRSIEDPDPVHAALKKLGEACKATDWPAELAARRELIALGDPVVRTLRHELGETEDARVRRACYEILGESFAKDEQAVRLLADGGLFDKDDGIRYGAAFRLGDLKAYRAHRRLRLVMGDVKAPDFLRLAAAKSLAQLGEPDALPFLCKGATADDYMSRYMAGIGLKALSGKNLDDFEGYQFGEGAYVSGGYRDVGSPRRPRRRREEGQTPCRGRRLLPPAQGRSPRPLQARHADVLKRGPSGLLRPASREIVRLATRPAMIVSPGGVSSRGACRGRVGRDWVPFARPGSMGVISRRARPRSGCVGFVFPRAGALLFRGSWLRLASDARGTAGLPLDPERNESGPGGAGMPDPPRLGSSPPVGWHRRSGRGRGAIGFVLPVGRSSRRPAIELGSYRRARRLAIGARAGRAGP